MNIEIIGVPLDLGADRRGVDMGPSAIRYAMLHQELRDNGFEFEDIGNIQVPIAEMCSITEPNLKYINCIIPMARRTSGAVATAISGGKFPLVLGGDHSIAIGSIHGAARNRRLGVIWIDAHADFNTPETTPSGNIHGMPLAALCGLGDSRLTKLWEDDTASVDPNNVAVIGARSIDAGERENLLKAGAHVFSMDAIDRQGIHEVMRQAIELVTKNTDGLYLSFDADSLDPRHAPGVGTAVPGGLTYREAHLACEMIAETGKLIGMDMVEVNPILDNMNQTAHLAVELILSSFGKKIWQ